MTRNRSKKLKSEKAINLRKLIEIQDELEKISEDANQEVKEVEQKYDDLRMQLYLKQNEMGENLDNSFWKVVFLSHPVLRGLLTEYDTMIFEYLRCIRVENYVGRVKAGYIIAFCFWPNPFFENPWLAKSFIIGEDGKTTKVVGMKIDWKEGMADSEEVYSYEEVEGYKRVAPEKTFFSWFTDSEDIKEDKSGDLVAYLVKEVLWVDPFEYY